MMVPALLMTAEFSTGNINSVCPAVFCKSLSVGAGNVRFGALGAMFAGPLYPTMMPPSHNVCLQPTSSEVDIV